MSHKHYSLVINCTLIYMHNAQNKDSYNHDVK